MIITLWRLFRQSVAMRERPTAAIQDEALLQPERAAVAAGICKKEREGGKEGRRERVGGGAFRVSEGVHD